MDIVVGDLIFFRTFMLMDIIGLFGVTPNNTRVVAAGSMP